MLDFYIRREGLQVLTETNARNNQENVITHCLASFPNFTVLVPHMCVQKAMVAGMELAYSFNNLGFLSLTLIWLPPQCMSNRPRTEIYLYLAQFTKQTSNSLRIVTFQTHIWPWNHRQWLITDRRDILSEYLFSYHAVSATSYACLECIHCYDIINSLLSIKENSFSLK